MISIICSNIVRAVRYRPIAFGLLGLGVPLGGVFVFGNLSVSALHGAAWVNDHVQWQAKADGTAKPTVTGWEQECTTAFNENRAHYSHKTEAQQRSIVNMSAYLQDIWLSRRGDARNISNTPINAGDSVNMQINDILFLCAIITMQPSGFGIAQDHKVTNTNYPNDRAPVPDNGAVKYKVNQASRYESNSRIYDLRVVSGQGTLTNKPIGDILGYKRDQNSRYWAAPPVPFTYKAPANWGPGPHRVVIEIDYATIQTYHNYGGRSGSVNRCVLRSSGDGANVSYGAYHLCTRRTKEYAFTFNVNTPPSPASVRPMSVVDKPNIAAPDVATFAHSVNLTTGSLDGKSLGYSVQRFRDGVPVGAPQTGIYTYSAGNYEVRTNTYTPTSGDAGATICEELTLSNVPGGTVSISDNPSRACTDVANQPYVKIFGGDVASGNGLATGAGVCTPNADGAIISWNLGASSYGAAGTQYAAFALGKIIDFAAAQHSAGAGPPSSLAFANTGMPSGNEFGGGWGSGACIPDYFASKPSGAGVLGAAPNLTSLASGSYANSGNVTITGGGQATITPDKKLQLYVEGDVYIRGNITFAGSWSLSHAPLLQLVVKGDILIDPSVTRPDGIYIAQKGAADTGIIYTCADAAGPLPTDGGAFYAPCNNQLVVNGSFTADQVRLLRTKGTSGQSGGDSAAAGTSDAAEQFNFSPLFWMQQPPSGPTSGKYDAITSLPPVL